MTSTTGGLRSIVGKMGNIFMKHPTVTNEPNARLIRPIVPPVTGWATSQISVKGEDSQKSLVDFMCRHYAISRTFVHRLLKDGKIWLKRSAMVKVGEGEEKPLARDSDIKSWTPRKSLRVEEGDLVMLTEISLPLKRPIPTQPSMKLTENTIKFIQDLVLYKDDRIIIINKPAGIAVHGGTKNDFNISRMLDALKFDSEIAPLPVHRLDKGTSGILMLARSREIAAQLSETLRENKIEEGIEKVYWAMVKGRPDKNHRKGEIVTNIYKAIPEPNEKMTSFMDRRCELLDEGKPAITKYRWLQQHVQLRPREKLSLMELIPLTGRTHQIRVHLAEQLGLPIIGDYRYFPNQKKGLKLHLHCYRVTLKNWLGVSKHLTVKAPIPTHFVETMNTHPLKLDEIPKFARKKQ